MGAGAVVDVLLARLQDAGLVARVAPGGLVVEGGPGAQIPPGLRAEIKRRRVALLELVRSRGGVVGPTPRLDEAVEVAPGLRIVSAGLAGGESPTVCHDCRGRSFWRVPPRGSWICLACHPPGSDIGAVEPLEVPR